MTKQTPSASSKAAAIRMKAARQRDTEPEIALRRALHAMGMRFRVNQQVVLSLRGRADIVFRRAKVAVFVDGCFWHSCPRHGTKPKANGHWWKEKLSRNRQRDTNCNRQLRRAGWKVIRIWEHADSTAAAERIVVEVQSRISALEH